MRTNAREPTPHPEPMPLYFFALEIFYLIVLGFPAVLSNQLPLLNFDAVPGLFLS